jgi:hypothetical protein
MHKRVAFRHGRYLGDVRVSAQPVTSEPTATPTGAASGLSATELAKEMSNPVTSI